MSAIVSALSQVIGTTDDVPFSTCATPNQQPQSQEQ
ncbi:hypothetical protein Tco_0221611, partial [Tanacetum coccineum]